MNFKDKLIWITGASSGIGEHLAYAFAREGAKLILSSRKTAALEKVKGACADPQKVAIVPLDVADLEAVKQTAKTVLDTHGLPDILVNNAGISQRALAVETVVEVDQQIMQVNYFGTVALIKALLPEMIRQRKCHIVSMSSVMGIFGAPWRTAYCASKHAMNGFHEGLRAELHPYGIPVTVLMPGYVNTNVTINALKGDGTPNAVKAKTTAGGWDPEYFAKRALRVIARRKKEAVLAGPRERLAVFLKRFLPPVLHIVLNGLKPSE